MILVPIDSYFQAASIGAVCIILAIIDVQKQLKYLCPPDLLLAGLNFVFALTAAEAATCSGAIEDVSSITNSGEVLNLFIK